MEDINWDLCCLCQEDNTEKLQKPKEDGYFSLERDLHGFRAISVVPSCVKVSLEKLDEGSGIAATLQAHNAKYHKLCRTYCSNSRLKRLISKEETSDHKAPKKLRSAMATHSSPQGVQCCIICEGEDQKNLHKVATDNVDANLKSWAKTNENFQLLGRLIAQAADAHAGDTYYHIQCYLHLRDSARSINRRASTGPPVPTFDAIVTAQIVALVEDSASVFKLSSLRKLYRRLTQEQGTPCSDPREPHSTRFKEHLLNLLPECAEFSQGKEVYISSKKKVGDVLSKAHESQIGQDDALLLMRAAVMLHRCCLERKTSFNGTFSPDCLTSPVPDQLRSFINIILQGPSILQEQDNVELETQLNGRAKIACTIAQQIIFNTCHGVRCTGLCKCEGGCVNNED